MPGSEKQVRRPQLTLLMPLLALLVGVAVLAVAIFVRHQPIQRVRFPGGMVVEMSDSKVAGAQQELSATLARYVARANKSTSETPTDTANLAGAWRGDNGASYKIQQFGADLVIQESYPSYGITAVGSGSVDGTEATVSFQAADGSTGVGRLHLVDRTSLQARFTSPAATNVVDMTRVGGGGTSTTQATTPPQQQQEQSTARYASYTAPTSGYSAELPVGGGWSIVPEQGVNSGLLRTVARGPQGATVWIDVTPYEAPQLATDQIDVISDVMLDADVREVEFTGSSPSFCEDGPCVDYLFDLGQAGIAIVGGPTAQAREIARHVLDTLG